MLRKRQDRGEVLAAVARQDSSKGRLHINLGVKQSTDGKRGDGTTRIWGSMAPGWTVNDVSVDTR
jgi:hypothetical protein